MANIDLFPDEKLISAAEKGDISAAAELDKAGIIACPYETPAEYAARIRKMRKNLEEVLEKVKNGKNTEIFPGIKVNAQDRIAPEIIAEASAVTMKKYGFAILWARGFYPVKELGPLWGGCAVCDDKPESVPLFIIRRAFAKKEKYFIYSRLELLSHELCHTARMFLRDRALEEHFAYSLSRSSLRRGIGNCFQTELDAFFLLIPVFLLLGVQIANTFFGMSLPVWVFGLLSAVQPLRLLVRNAVQREKYFRAVRVLHNAKFSNPEAALFRCKSEEIYEISKMAPQDAAKFFEGDELRKKVIKYRFSANAR